MVKRIERHCAIVHDNLVVVRLRQFVGIIGPDDRAQPVAIFENPAQPFGDGESHLFALQIAHVGHKVHRHDFGCKGAVWGHDFDGTARVNGHLGGLQPAVVARFVVDQQGSGRFYIT